jgi:hypothetical protein
VCGLSSVHFLSQNTNREDPHHEQPRQVSRDNFKVLSYCRPGHEADIFGKDEYKADSNDYVRETGFAEWVEN